MRKPQGYAIWTDPVTAPVERDTFTCAHCNRVVIVAPKTDPTDLGGFCRMCMQHLCGPCADLGTCTPFEQRLDAMERRDRLHRAMGLVG
jgi:hypothetical protein